MLKYLLPFLLLTGPALAQNAPSAPPPDYAAQALGSELVKTIGEKVQAQAQILALQARIADLEKQVAALKPTPAPDAAKP